MKILENDQLYPIVELHGKKYWLVKSLSPNAAIAWAKECFPGENPMNALRFDYDTSKVQVLWPGTNEVMETCHLILEENIDKSTQRLLIGEIRFLLVPVMGQGSSKVTKH